MERTGNSLFPIFLKIDQLQILIVGGGNVGLEKLEGLLKNDPQANITMVSRAFKEEIINLALEHSSVKLIKKPFAPGYLQDIEIAILATEKRELNHFIRDMAKARNILVNAADTPDLCDFYLGSTVKRGDLKIGVSTNGKSPTFAKRFRQVLEEALPEETEELMINLRTIRDRLKGDFNHKVKKLNELTKELVS
ncbi:MAG: bifunctional precorrin-2 dehydrogenase/sirohydrochlorin ferrochelatase [Bacteroidota bacterium]